MLCQIRTEHKVAIDSLMLSADGTILMAKLDGPGALVYWEIRSNSGAIALNLSGDDTNNYAYNDG